MIRDGGGGNHIKGGTGQDVNPNSKWKCLFKCPQQQAPAESLLTPGGGVPAHMCMDGPGGYVTVLINDVFLFCTRKINAMKTLSYLHSEYHAVFNEVFIWF